MKGTVKGTVNKRAAKVRRIVYRPRRYDVGGAPFDATVTLEPGAPEPVFDRVTGPFSFDEDL